jgi:hypothetical protein
MITNVLSLQYIVVYYDILSDMSIYIAIVDRVLSYTSKHVVKGDIENGDVWTFILYTKTGRVLLLTINTYFVGLKVYIVEIGNAIFSVGICGVSDWVTVV